MKCTKHYENGRIYVYFQDDNGVSDCVSFGSEHDMRRMGECLIDLYRTGGNEVEIKPKQ